MLVPDILDYDLPMFGCFHNCAFVKIRKEYPCQARRVMHAIWGAGQMALTKIIVVVDEHVDVHDSNQVLFHLCANVDPQRDLEIVRGPLDILDHAAPFCGAGSKVGIDATAKIPGEGLVRAWPPVLAMTPEVKELVARRWTEYGI
jgi:4-hydroxy-3-polyprenylbenzoate decarboxylase